MQQVEDALARQVLYGGDLVTNLLEVTGPEREGALTYVLAEHLAMPPGPSGELPAASQALRDTLPEELMLRHGLFPVSLGAEGLRVAVSQPLSEEVLRELEFVVEAPIVQVAAPSARIQQALARDYGASLDRRTTRLLAKLAGRPDPSPSIRPPGPEALRFPRAFSPETTALRSDLPPPMPRTEPERRIEPGGRSSLVRWALGVHTDERTSRRRRRGPFAIPDAEASLFAATAPEAVLETVFEFARQYFAYTAVFVVHREVAEGRDAHGPGADRREVLGVGVPLEQESILSLSWRTAAPVSRALGADGIDGALRDDLRRPVGVVPVVVPVVVRDRAVLLLYGDDGDEQVFLGEVSEVLAMCALAGGALERIARERRRVARGVEAPHDLPDAPVPGGPDAPSSERVSRPDPRATDGSGEQTPRTPPPESSPSLDVAEADPAEDELLRAALDQASGDGAGPAGEGDASASRVAYRPPAPLPRTADPTRASVRLPSVIVAMGEPEARAVDALLAEGADETEAMGEILRLGETIVPALLARLPGPLSVELAAVARGVVRPSRAGVLFRALAALRRIALHYVIVHAANMREETRLTACLALAEFAYPESASALVQRLFDPAPRVREAAMTASRWLRASPECSEGITGQLSRIAVATMERTARRIAATEALGELGAKEAIPALLALSTARDEGLRDAGRQALARVTFQDLDFDGYERWWRRHEGEHSAQWALDALVASRVDHARPAIRELSILGLDTSVDLEDPAARDALVRRARAALDKLASPSHGG